jgi:hypothetical protein
MECCKCHQIKELSKPKSKTCKSCKNSYERARRNSSENKIKELERARQLYQKKKNLLNMCQEITLNLEKTKECTCCRTSKTLHDFFFHKYKGSFQAVCKECAKLKRKEYYQKSKQQVL